MITVQLLKSHIRILRYCLWVTEKILLKATLTIGILIILFNTLNTSFHIVDETVMEKSVLYSQIKRIAYGVFPYFKELLFRQ